MATQIKKAETAFPLSKGQRRPRAQRPDHLAFIRSLPCVITGKKGPNHAAHIRYGSLRHGKRETGVGEKPADCWTVPLSEEQHLTAPDAQHRSGEKRWWEAKGIDPLVIAALLFTVSGDEEAGCQIVASALELILWRR